MKYRIVTESKVGVKDGEVIRRVLIETWRWYWPWWVSLGRINDTATGIIPVCFSSVEEAKETLRRRRWAEDPWKRTIVEENA